MKYRITGVFRDSNHEILLVLDALNVDEANHIAENHNISVSTISKFCEDTSTFKMSNKQNEVGAPSEKSTTGCLGIGCLSVFGLGVFLITLLAMIIFFVRKLAAI